MQGYVHDVFPYDPGKRFSVLRTPGRVPPPAANEPETATELDPELVPMRPAASTG
jgi:hypothetical protein